MVQRFKHQTLGLIPATRPAVERGDRTRVHGRLLREALPQQFAKQMVVAIPATLVVQGNEEQIGAFDGFKGRLPGANGHGENRVTQRATEPLKH